MRFASRCGEVERLQPTGSSASQQKHKSTPTLIWILSLYMTPFLDSGICKVHQTEKCLIPSGCRPVDYSKLWEQNQLRALSINCCSVRQSFHPLTPRETFQSIEISRIFHANSHNALAPTWEGG